MAKKVQKKSLTYKDSGVDIAAGNRAVALMKKKAEETFRHYKGKIISGIGGFGAVIQLRDGSIMALSTDGVGTKLKLAIIFNKHDTVGIDLVAMCVNDIAVSGVTPLFFFDYIAQGKQIPKKTAIIGHGIINGCEQAECALPGGEMAELKVLYKPDDYDLAGFAVGLASSRKKLILGNGIKPGMYAYGALSNGVHSNGYSLIWDAFGIDFNKPKMAKRKLEKFYPEIQGMLYEELLKPTAIYVKLIKKLVAKHNIAGMAHITGGGLIENPPRIIPDNCAIQFKKNSWPTPSIFELIQKKGNVTDREMLKTFNMGIALVIISPDDDIKGLTKIGEVVERRPGQRRVRFKK